MRKIKFRPVVVGLILAIFWSCGTGKKQKASLSMQEVEMNLTEIPQEDEEDAVPPPPPPHSTVRFVPPVIAEDEVVADYEIHTQEDLLVSREQLSIADMDTKEVLPNNVYHSPQRHEVDTEEYSSFVENGFMLAQSNPLSTFSIDVDNASYSNVRRFINQGQKPRADAVRVEEMINYFDYQYPAPKGADPVHISIEIGASPWNKGHRLVKIGLKAKDVDLKDLPNSNLVFLIDVSGSMSGATRLDLVKSSMKLLLDNLRADDRVAIVVYANEVGVKLPSTPVSEKDKIIRVLDGLEASGGTSGGDGIQQAYKVAEKNFIKGGNNRIILCTDGDFNIGISDDAALEKMIESKRESGVFLSILGYGMGNYKDRKMQTLSQAGNGNHAYIDNLQEAQKVLEKEFKGTMFTLAKDVKIQVEFNPAKVQAYRLVGYETRKLNKEDFNDDTKDASEMGVGHTVTALYEVVPVGVTSNMIPSVDPLKYQTKEEKSKVKNTSNEMLTVKLRYKEPAGNTSKLLSRAVVDRGGDDVSQDFRFVSAVAMFGQLLRNSKYKGESDYEQVIALAKKGLNNDEQGYRREFVRLAEAMKSIH